MHFTIVSDFILNIRDVNYYKEFTYKEGFIGILGYCTYKYIAGFVCIVPILRPFWCSTLNI